MGPPPVLRGRAERGVEEEESGAVFNLGSKCLSSPPRSARRKPSSSASWLIVFLFFCVLVLGKRERNLQAVIGPGRLAADSRPFVQPQRRGRTRASPTRGKIRNRNLDSEAIADREARIA